MQLNVGPTSHPMAERKLVKSRPRITRSQSQKKIGECPKEGSACISNVSYNPTDNIHIHIIKH